jgi:hypothetical protein
MQQAEVAHTLVTIYVNQKVRIQGQYFIEARHLRFVGIILWQQYAYVSRETAHYSVCM